MVSREENALAAWQRLLGALVVVAAVSAGCTTSDPDKQVYSLVACGGGDNGVPDICDAKAAELCPNGYTVLGQDFGTAGGEPQEKRIACRQNSAKP